jgi:hypothetical protein
LNTKKKNFKIRVSTVFNLWLNTPRNYGC